MRAVDRARGLLTSLWALWILSSLAASAVFAYMLLETEDQTVFMPGPLSDGHHQLSGDCTSCHTNGFGGDVALQEACESCHGDARVKPFDSHPKAKFDDPRNAARLEMIDARTCVTCHVEHQPEHTLTDGLTQPGDFCVYCHLDISEERPSHIDMEFVDCTTSGCHNYHDNRALYTDFLIKHADAPALLDQPVVDLRDFGEVFPNLLQYPHDRFPASPLASDAADAPSEAMADADIIDNWHGSPHASSGVNCTGCHSPGDGVEWQVRPGAEGCAGCHDIELQRFADGKHGMRSAAGLSAMAVTDARLPMHAEPAHTSVDCGSCHDPHKVDVIFAAVEACESCHADDHTLAYQGSPHFQAWDAEVAGDAAAGSGVSCATCHMPRVSMDVDDWNSRTVVDHNQSDTLSPSSKMLRPVCLECHGLGFSLDALADPTLSKSNYSGSPTISVPSIEMAVTWRDEARRRKLEAAQ